VAESCDHLNRKAQQGSISVRLHVSIDGAGVPPLESQFAISRWGGSRRAYPYAFTEQGVAMLSSVLRSKELFKSTLASCGRVSPSRNDRFEQKASETLTDLEEKYDAQFVVVVEAIRNPWRNQRQNPAASASRRERFVIHAAGVGSVAPALARQQCLYFLPLPQGQSALRPIPWRRRGIMWSSDPVSW
jgi:ORF6N domain